MNLMLTSKTTDIEVLPDFVMNLHLQLKNEREKQRYFQKNKLCYSMIWRLIHQKLLLEPN